jgi:hypothetical protein
MIFFIRSGTPEIIIITVIVEIKLRQWISRPTVKKKMNIIYSRLVRRIKKYTNYSAADR